MKRFENHWNFNNKMTTQISHVDLEGYATIKCKYCGNNQRISVEILPVKKSSYNIKCKCGEILSVSFDYRKFYRKKIDLSGTFCNINDENLEFINQNRLINCRINNISMTGVGIIVIGNHSIEFGDVLFLSFTLDDPKRSQIKKTCVVKNVDDYFIGLEFKDVNPYNKKIGFYLMN